MNGPALLALQLVDSQLDQIVARRKRLPERVALADAQGGYQRWVAARDEQHQLIASAEAAIAEAEAAGVEIDRKKARFDAQLKTVIAPREAEALMHEIDGLVAQHSALDDVELEAMEVQSSAETVLAELALTEPALAAAVADAQAALDTALAALADEERVLREQRAAGDSELDEAERALYAATVARHGGIGFCRLERHTCSGCHVDLSQVEFERVQAEAARELPECPHCGRLLVVG